MSRSYQKNNVGRAHFREFGAKTIRRDIQKKMRGRVKAMKDEEGIPTLPRKINFWWPSGGKRRNRYYSEDIFWPDDAKLARIGRKLEYIHKYSLPKQDVKFIYRMKIK